MTSKNFTTKNDVIVWLLTTSFEERLRIINIAWNYSTNSFTSFNDIFDRQELDQFGGSLWIASLSENECLKIFETIYVLLPTRLHKK